MNDGMIIARGGLNLRAAPKSGEVVKVLRRGSLVEVLSEETWLRVKARDGSTGYVLADYVERDPAAVIMPEGPSRALTGGLQPPVAGPSAVCVLAPYHNTQFKGQDVRADVDFFPLLDRLNDYARGSGVQIHVTSSFRDRNRQPSGAIVPPATRSNHLVGHAIDMNLASPSGFFNSRALDRDNLANLPAEVRGFIDKVRADPVLRWGGDFSPEDPVHIDDQLNRTDPGRWQSKLDSLP